MAQAKTRPSLHGGPGRRLHNQQGVSRITSTSGYRGGAARRGHQRNRGAAVVSGPRSARQTHCARFRARRAAAGDRRHRRRQRGRSFRSGAGGRAAIYVPHLQQTPLFTGPFWSSRRDVRRADARGSVSACSERRGARPHDIFSIVARGAAWIRRARPGHRLGRRGGAEPRRRIVVVRRRNGGSRDVHCGVARFRSHRCFACLLPAQRALGVDPRVALKHE
jgi:hypothetical protein